MWDVKEHGGPPYHLALHKDWPTCSKKSAQEGDRQACVTGRACSKRAS